MGEAEGRVHVLLLPVPGHGHLTPALQLAHALASQQGFFITLALTAGARAGLQLPAAPSPPNIRIHVLDDGLPPLSSHNRLPLQDHLASLPILQQSLDTLLQALMASPSPVTCLIADTFCVWSQPVTRKFNIPCAELLCLPACTLCAIFFYDRLHSAGLVPFKGSKEDTWITCTPGLPPMKASDFIQEHLPSEEEVQADPQKLLWHRNLINEVNQNAKDHFRILVNTINDLESQALDALCAEHVPVCAIGPLFLHKFGANETDLSPIRPRTSFYQEDHTCLQWLDGKPPASTLYVAFGSECRIDKKDMHELAYGLEASGHNFLWVIRPGSVLGDISAEEDVLPEGFKERVGERGMVVSWAPQIDVLAHSATGGYLCHCGWNSSLEALWLGTPILAWPQTWDHPLIKKFVEDEWKVGIGIKKNEEGRISRITVENGVRSLLQGEVATRLRKAAKEVKELMLKAVQDGGSSRANLDQFIQDLRNLRTAQSDNKT